MKAESAVNIIDVSYFYRTRQALDGVSVEVNRGEIFGFLGPNGSGKTTLFKVLATLALPSSGTVRIEGMDLLTDAAAIRRILGTVFQAPALDRKLTVEENLKIQGRLYGLPKSTISERIRLVLEALSLTERKNERIETLSGGLRRRVELAKGLMHGPDVLIMDEPSTGLDPGARVEFWSYLKTVRETHAMTVLLTTHLLDEAERCDRLGIMDNGRLVAVDTPACLKAGVGEEVVSIRTEEVEKFALLLRDTLHLDARVVGDVVRIEHPAGHRYVETLVERFPGRIQSVTLSRPTLEDVFVHHTGRMFGNNATAVREK